MALSLHLAQAEPATDEPMAWLTLWARCWLQIRAWRLPPQWSIRDWCEEARAQGGLADSLACKEFDSSRGVPLDAFRYRRVVNAVWTRWRQEWAYGRLARSGVTIPDPALPEPDANEDLFAWIESSLASLAELDRGLIRQLFWDGRREDDLAREWGISQQAVNKRKQRILRQLRRGAKTP